MFQSLLKFTGLDCVSFKWNVNQRLDAVICELRDQFKEPFSITRDCRENKPFIKVIFLDNTAQPEDRTNVKDQILAATGELPIEFQHIRVGYFNLLLFEGLRKLA